MILLKIEDHQEEQKWIVVSQEEEVYIWFVTVEWLQWNKSKATIILNVKVFLFNV